MSTAPAAVEYCPDDCAGGPGCHYDDGQKIPPEPDDSQAVTPAAPAADGGPAPFLRGTFALFLTPKGGVVLATNTDLTGPQHMELPRMLVRQAAKGNPLVRQLLDGAAAAQNGN